MPDIYLLRRRIADLATGAIDQHLSGLRKTNDQQSSVRGFAAAATSAGLHPGRAGAGAERRRAHDAADGGDAQRTAGARAGSVCDVHFTRTPGHGECAKTYVRFISFHLNLPAIVRMCATSLPDSSNRE